MAKRKKFTDQEIIDFIHSINYEFIEFIDDTHRMLLIKCNKGHVYKTTWVNIYNKSRRCKICAYNNKPKTRKLVDINKLVIELDKLGYKYLRLFTKRDFEYVEYICSNGHKHATRLYCWLKGVRCGKCKGNIEVTFSKVQQSFKKEDYILFTKCYGNNTSRLDYECSLGHVGSTNWMQWRSGVRCPICAVINNSGPNSYLWKGGINLEPYCDAWNDKNYKSDIRKRDNNVCQNPYCYQTTKKLHIHHIDYDKKNCHPSNLVTVCGSCNSRANGRRKWHTLWYQIIMKKKFGYVY